MEPADWAVSSAVFVVAVAVTLAVAPSLLPEKPPAFSESQLEAILESVSEEIQIKSLILKSDCNQAQYDCNREYPIEVDVNQSKHSMFSQAYTQDGNKIYSVMPLGAVTKLYSFTQQKITPSYNTSAFTISVSGDTNYAFSHINVSNQFLDANITDWNATIDFRGSNEQDIIIGYPKMKMLKLKETKTAVVVGNDANKFYLRFFPNSAEFWIDVPEDINISIKPMHANWKKDENIGVWNNDSWWDNDATDAYIWHYRLPITVHSIDYARQDLALRLDINFALQKERLGLQGLSIYPYSFRLIEYRDGKPYDATTQTYDGSLALANQPFKVTYFSGTQMAILDWILKGFTPANSHRVYYLYFDFNNYPKPAFSYSNITYVPPQYPVYVTTAYPQGQPKPTVIDTNKLFVYNPNTILINTVNQLSRVWQYSAINYRKPLVFDSGKYPRSAMRASVDINFAFEFSLVGCNNCDLNLDSLSFVEVNNWNEGTIIHEFVKSDQNTLNSYNYSYNPYSKIMTLSWSVPSTPAMTKRHYFLYYNNTSS
ncbi:MAG: hypothetical protein QXK06_02295 [Candidatus Diapherotrites archaeon]